MITIENLIPPNGCACCGAQERGHAIRHGGGHHTGDGSNGRYVTPTDGLRLARMRARRALRSALTTIRVTRG